MPGHIYTFNIEINVVCCVGSVQIQIKIEKGKVGVLPIRIVKSNVLSVDPW